MSFATSWLFGLQMPAESICLLNAVSARAAHHLFGFFEFGLAAIV
jgi:hypothetical protein